MRLLTISHFFEGHGGGIERVAGQICRELIAAGHEAMWAASRQNEPPHVPGLTVIPVKTVNPTEQISGLPMPLPLLSGLKALRKAVTQSDAVIIHDALYVTSIVGALFARQLGKPVILIQHISEINFANVMMRRLMQFSNRVVTFPMLRMADQTVFISEKVRQDFADLGLAPAPRLIFNGVDTKIFYPAPSDRGALGLPSKGQLAVFVGRFVEKKGLTVIRELARLRPHTHFALAGTGPIDPATWGLPNVTILGPLSQAKVAALFNAADCLLLPSIGEGYPLVVQEAMACGLPTICGSDSAKADIAAQEWLHSIDVEPERIAITAQQASLALDKLEPCTEQREKMIAHATNAYSWANMARELITITTDLQARSNGLVRQ